LKHQISRVATNVNSHVVSNANDRVVSNDKSHVVSNANGVCRATSSHGTGTEGAVTETTSDSEAAGAKAQGGTAADASSALTSSTSVGASTARDVLSAASNSFQPRTHDGAARWDSDQKKAHKSILSVAEDVKSLRALLATKKDERRLVFAAAAMTNATRKQQQMQLHRDKIKSLMKSMDDIAAGFYDQPADPYLGMVTTMLKPSDPLRKGNVAWFSLPQP